MQNSVYLTSRKFILLSQINDQFRRPNSVNTTTAPIIEKIKKLLALADSSNEYEAALAAGYAQRLLPLIGETFP